MRFLVLSLSLLFLDPLLSADIKPDASVTPLFKVFKPIQTAPDSYDSGPLGRPTHHWTVDDKHPLVVVSALNDFLLEADKKRVRVVLNKSDAKIVAKAFNDFGVLGITAGDTVAILMSSTPFDGSLSFDDPMAGYLRHRFHIAPGTNELEPGAPKPFSVHA